MVWAARTVEIPWWASVLFSLAILALALYAKNHDADDVRRLQSSEWASRGAGLFLMAIGLGGLYLLAYTPICEAIMHKCRIWIHRGAVAVPVIMVLVGLTLMIAGKRSSRFIVLGHSGRLTPLQWTFVAASLLISLSLEFALYQFFRTQGYAGF